MQNAIAVNTMANITKNFTDAVETAKSHKMGDNAARTHPKIASETKPNVAMRQNDNVVPERQENT